MEVFQGVSDTDFADPFPAQTATLHTKEYKKKHKYVKNNNNNKKHHTVGPLKMVSSYKNEFCFILNLKLFQTSL